MTSITENGRVHVTCGDIGGILLLNKFYCPAIHSACIEYEGQIITPKAFCIMGNKHRLKDWKSAIRINGLPLRKMIDTGQLDFYRHDEFCTGRCTSRGPLNRIANLSSIAQEAKAVTVTQTYTVPKPTSTKSFAASMPALKYFGETSKNNQDSESSRPVDIADTLYRRLIDPGPAESGDDGSSGDSRDAEFSMRQIISPAVLKQPIKFNRPKAVLDSDNETVTVSYAQLSDDQQFWLGIVENSLCDEIFSSIHQALDTIKSNLITYCVRETDAYCLSNIVRELGLMTTMKSKLAALKSDTDQQQMALENEMQELKKKMAEYESRKNALKRKSEKFDHLIATAESKKRKVVRVLPDSDDFILSDSNSSHEFGESNPHVHGAAGTVNSTSVHRHMGYTDNSLKQRKIQPQIQHEKQSESLENTVSSLAAKLSSTERWKSSQNRPEQSLMPTSVSTQFSTSSGSSFTRFTSTNKSQFCKQCGSKSCVCASAGRKSRKKMFENARQRARAMSVQAARKLKRQAIYRPASQKLKTSPRKPFVYLTENGQNLSKNAAGDPPRDHGTTATSELVLTEGLHHDVCNQSQNSHDHSSEEGDDSFVISENHRNVSDMNLCSSQSKESVISVLTVVSQPMEHVRIEKTPPVTNIMTEKTQPMEHVLTEENKLSQEVLTVSNEHSGLSISKISVTPEESENDGDEAKDICSDTDSKTGACIKVKPETMDYTADSCTTNRKICSDSHDSNASVEHKFEVSKPTVNTANSIKGTCSKADPVPSIDMKSGVAEDFAKSAGDGEVDSCASIAQKSEEADVTVKCVVEECNIKAEGGVSDGVGINVPLIEVKTEVVSTSASDANEESISTCASFTELKSEDTEVASTVAMAMLPADELKSEETEVSGRVANAILPTTLVSSDFSSSNRNECNSVEVEISVSVIAQNSEGMNTKTSSHNIVNAANTADRLSSIEQETETEVMTDAMVGVGTHDIDSIDAVTTDVENSAKTVAEQGNPRQRSESDRYAAVSVSTQSPVTACLPSLGDAPVAFISKPEAVSETFQYFPETPVDQIGAVVTVMNPERLELHSSIDAMTRNVENYAETFAEQGSPEQPSKSDPYPVVSVTSPKIWLPSLGDVPVTVISKPGTSLVKLAEVKLSKPKLSSSVNTLSTQKPPHTGYVSLLGSRSVATVKGKRWDFQLPVPSSTSSTSVYSPLSKSANTCALAGKSDIGVPVIVRAKPLDGYCDHSYTSTQRAFNIPITSARLNKLNMTVQDQTSSSDPSTTAVPPGEGSIIGWDHQCSVAGLPANITALGKRSISPLAHTIGSNSGPQLLEKCNRSLLVKTPASNVGPSSNSLLVISSSVPTSTLQPPVEQNIAAVTVTNMEVTETHDGVDAMTINVETSEAVTEQENLATITALRERSRSPLAQTIDSYSGPELLGEKCSRNLPVKTPVCNAGPSGSSLLVTSPSASTLTSQTPVDNKCPANTSIVIMYSSAPTTPAVVTGAQDSVAKRPASQIGSRNTVTSPTFIAVPALRQVAQVGPQLAPFCRCTTKSCTNYIYVFPQMDSGTQTLTKTRHVSLNRRCINSSGASCASDADEKQMKLMGNAISAQPQNNDIDGRVQILLDAPAKQSQNEKQVRAMIVEDEKVQILHDAPAQPRQTGNTKTVVLDDCDKDGQRVSTHLSWLSGHSLAIINKKKEMTATCVDDDSNEDFSYSHRLRKRRRNKKVASYLEHDEEEDYAVDDDDDDYVCDDEEDEDHDFDADVYDDTVHLRPKLMKTSAAQSVNDGVNKSDLFIMNPRQSGITALTPSEMSTVTAERTSAVAKIAKAKGKSTTEIISINSVEGTLVRLLSEPKSAELTKQKGPIAAQPLSGVEPASDCAHLALDDANLALDDANVALDDANSASGGSLPPETEFAQSKGKSLAGSLSSSENESVTTRGRWCQEDAVIQTKGKASSKTWQPASEIEVETAKERPSVSKNGKPAFEAEPVLAKERSSLETAVVQAREKSFKTGKPTEIEAETAKEKSSSLSRSGKLVSEVEPYRAKWRYSLQAVREMPSFKSISGTSESEVEMAMPIGKSHSEASVALGKEKSSSLSRTGKLTLEEEMASYKQMPPETRSGRTKTVAAVDPRCSHAIRKSVSNAGSFSQAKRKAAKPSDTSQAKRKALTQTAQQASEREVTQHQIPGAERETNKTKQEKRRIRTEATHFKGKSHLDILVTPLTRMSSRNDNRSPSLPLEDQTEDSTPGSRKSGRRQSQLPAKYRNDQILMLQKQSGGADYYS